MTMKLTAPKRTVIAAIRPNAGVRASYMRALRTLLDPMFAEVEEKVRRRYAIQMGADATLQSTLTQLRKKWLRVFDHMSATISEAFGNNVLRHSDLAFSAALIKGGFIVPFSMTPRATMEMAKVVRTNTALIKTIPSEFFSAIHQRVFESVQKGRDLAGLTEALHEEYAITRRRAAFISRDQNNRATAKLHAFRQKELGITRGIWHHTAASLHPREEHADFDGQEYDIETGHDFDNGSGPVLPGEDYNCGCIGSSVIPGYDEEEEAPEEENVA